MKNTAKKKAKKVEEDDEMKINSNSYYTVRGWMMKEGFCERDVKIYAILYGFSRDKSGCFNGSLEYLCQLSMLSESSVKRSLSKLLKVQAIRKTTSMYKGKVCNTYYTYTPNRIQYLSENMDEFYNRKFKDSSVKLTYVPGQIDLHNKKSEKEVFGLDKSNPSTDTSVNARNMKITYSADDKTAPANQSVNQLPAARSRAGEAGTGAKNIISRTGLTPGQKRTIDKINEVGLDFYETGCKLWKTKGFRFACQLQELRIQIQGYIDAAGTSMSAVEILEGMCSNAGKVKWLEAGFGPSGISHSFDQVRVAWERSLPKPAEKSNSFSKTDYKNLYENSLFSNQTMQ